MEGTVNPTAERGDDSREKSSGVGKKDSDKRIIRGTKAPNIPVYERRNWLIHMHYIRKDFETCKVLIGELLAETEEMCEYAIYVLGLISRQEGDIHSSLELFQKAVRLNPNNAASVKQVARSLYLLGRHKAAMDTYSEASLINPNDWEVFHNQGVCCIYLNDYDKAIELFLAAITESPQTVSFVQLGRVYLKRGVVEDAIEVYKRAIKHNPEDPDILSTLGLLYLQAGSPQKAFECLGSALTFDPTNPKAILAAGSLIQDNGEFDVALSKYKVAASGMPESPQLWNNIGMCFFGKMKYVAAISCLKRATYLAPFEWKILYNLGLIHLTMKQSASAFHFLRAAVALKPPQAGQLYMLLAISLTRLDDHPNAVQMYEEALKRDKDDPIINFNYTIFLYNADDKAGARRQFRLYETKSRKWTISDQEVLEMSKKMAPILHVGEDEESKTTSEDTEVNTPPTDPVTTDTSVGSEKQTKSPSKVKGHSRGVDTDSGDFRDRKMSIIQSKEFNM